MTECTNTLAAKPFGDVRPADRTKQRRRLARARLRVREAREMFDAFDDVVIHMGRNAPAVIHALHIEADAALNAALNEQDAAEEAMAA